jgi:uncharacterized surface protein with fasciclin (FAS1) repeats
MTLQRRGQMSTQEQTTTNQGAGRDESLVPKRMFETAQALPSVSRFVEAVKTVQMDTELRVTEWRTLFAPSNEALDAAPNDFWNELMKPENRERLRAILALHIVRGRQTLADLKNTATVKSISGEPVEVSVERSEARFGGARIVRADIPCTNGQIHIIDKLVVREYSYAG